MSAIQRQLLVFDFDWLALLSRKNTFFFQFFQVSRRSGHRQMDFRGARARYPSQNESREIGNSMDGSRVSIHIIQFPCYQLYTVQIKLQITPRST